MPGKGNSAVTETPNITWRNLHSPVLCLPPSLPPSLSLSRLSVVHPLILFSRALSRFKTHLQMQREPSIFQGFDETHLSPWHAAGVVKKLTYATANGKRFLGCLPLGGFLIGSLASFHLPTFSSGRSWRIAKHQREGPAGMLLLIISASPSEFSFLFCNWYSHSPPPQSAFTLMWQFVRSDELKKKMNILRFRF